MSRFAIAYTSRGEAKLVEWWWRSAGYEFHHTARAPRESAPGVAYASRSVWPVARIGGCLILGRRRRRFESIWTSERWRTFDFGDEG